MLLLLLQIVSISEEINMPLIILAKFNWFFMAQLCHTHIYIYNTRNKCLSHPFKEIVLLLMMMYIQYFYYRLPIYSCKFLCSCVVFFSLVALSPLFQHGFDSVPIFTAKKYLSLYLVEFIFRKYSSIVVFCIL